MLTMNAIDTVVRAALEEDAPWGDLTSQVLIPADADATAQLVAREAGVFSGGAVFAAAFRLTDPRIVVRMLVTDGAAFAAGDALAEVSGPARGILQAERIGLNFVQRMSGIATLTALYVAEIEGTRARIVDTRKTTPGLRALEKAAVRAGGGRNHRGNLSDWVMLKDNHLMGVGITKGVAAAKDRWPGRTVHVECERLEQVLEAVDAGADAILLDNMSPDEVRACVGAVRARCGDGRRPLLEVSGGVTLETVAGYASTGADLVSSGSLTNSARVLDIGLDILRSDDVKREA
jgi:nicotinate-nucleotide pyrophosphorylase (carboxylating)